MSLRRTPYYERHVALGARIVEFAGFEMPVQYSGILAEHRAVRTAAGLFDVSHMGEIRVTGPRAIEALDALLSNHVAAAAIGEAQYNIVCNHSGGVVDDVFVYRLGPSEALVCVNAANRAKDFAWFVNNNPFPGEATFTDEGDDWAQVALQGPLAERILARVCALDLAAMPRRRFAIGEVAGIAGCIVARTGYTGEDGFEIFAPAATAGGLFDALLDAGREDAILPIGLGARDTLRLEAGNCLYGHELDENTSPLQARLSWAVKLDKPGGFLGRESLVARQDRDTHRLASLIVRGKRIPREGMRVLRDGVDIGWLTSGTRSPTTDLGIALAYLAKPNGKPGTELLIDVRGKTEEAVVHSGAFPKSI